MVQGYNTLSLCVCECVIGTQHNNISTSTSTVKVVDHINNKQQQKPLKKMRGHITPQCGAHLLQQQIKNNFTSKITHLKVDISVAAFK